MCRAQFCVSGLPRLEYGLENLPVLFFSLLFVVNAVQYKNCSSQQYLCKCVLLLVVWLASTFHIISPSVPVALHNLTGFGLDAH